MLGPPLDRRVATRLDGGRGWGQACSGSGEGSNPRGHPPPILPTAAMDPSSGSGAAPHSPPPTPRNHIPAAPPSHPVGSPRGTPQVPPLEPVPSSLQGPPTTCLAGCEKEQPGGVGALSIAHKTRSSAALIGDPPHRLPKPQSLHQEQASSSAPPPRSPQVHRLLQSRHLGPPPCKTSPAASSPALPAQCPTGPIRPGAARARRRGTPTPPAPTPPGRLLRARA